MDRRFLAALDFRFDEVEDIGFARITFDEILRWYDRKRITKGVWQDIQDRWADRTDVPLLIGEASGAYILAWGEGLEAKQDSWLKPIDEYAKRSVFRMPGVSRSEAE